MQNSRNGERVQGQVRKSILTRTELRIILLLAYWVATSASIFILTPLADRGMGGEMAAVLSSWTFWLLALLFRLLAISYSNISILLGFPIAYLLYLAGLSAATTVLRRLTKFPLPIPSLLIHGCGTALFIRHIDYQGEVPPAPYLVISAIAGIIAVVYLTLDWVLAKDSRVRTRKAKSNPGLDLR